MPTESDGKRHDWWGPVTLKFSDEPPKKFGDMNFNAVKVNLDEGVQRCASCNQPMSPAIDWSMRRYLLGDVVRPAAQPDIGNEPGPFHVRIRDAEGNLANYRLFSVFKTRGEAQEFCDWMNRKLPWIYHYPSKRVLEEP